VVGEVIAADRFGNLLTTLTVEALERVGPIEALRVSVAGREIGAPVSSYSMGRDAAPSAIIGSTGRLEVFVRNGDARARFGIEPGTPVRVSRGES
jgi:S-adenosylmethionine hydrolase